MRKFLLTAFVVMLTFIGTAQEVIKSYALDVGYWNYNTEDWDWETRKTCNVSFLLQGDVIISNDLVGSTYYTYEALESSDKQASWLALDEERRECMVSMKFNKVNNYFVIIYSDICYRYIW